MPNLLVSILIITIGALWPLTVTAEMPVTQIEEAQLAAIFKNADATATFVLYDREANKLSIYNRERAVQRFIPASTFKIPNTLIGLGSGAVENVDEIFVWDGEPKYLETWEKDMGLREAIKVSSVPVYQELARRIGYERMLAAVMDFSYGNMEIGNKNQIDTFWLEGPLKISAVEQAVFLTRLATGELPSIQEHVNVVKEITLFMESVDKSLHAKTGYTGNATTPPLGWWVGWVEEKNTGRVWSFALNLDLPDYPAGPDRIELGLECLKALGVWE